MDAKMWKTKQVGKTWFRSSSRNSPVTNKNVLVMWPEYGNAASTLTSAVVSQTGNRHVLPVCVCVVNKRRWFTHVFHFRPLSPPPDPGCAWFQFDDSRVHPISSSQIEKQFAGRESAYMLFYRRKCWHRPEQGTSSAPRRAQMALCAETLSSFSTGTQWSSTMKADWLILLKLKFSNLFCVSYGDLVFGCSIWSVVPHWLKTLKSFGLCTRNFADISVRNNFTSC